MEKFKKQSYEEFVIGADFSANFDSGTVISSEVVTATDKNGLDVTATITDQASVSNDGTSVVNVLIRAGDQTLSPYKITFRIIDSVSNKWELDVKMEVKEI